MRNKSLLLILFSLFTLIPGGCQKEKSEDTEIVIAEQFGLAYAPLQVLKETGALKDAPEGTRVRWVRTANATAIREAMAAGRMDIGFMGIPPFLIGADRGMDWKVFGGLSRSPLGLVTNLPELRTLQDFAPHHRIALPQPGSIQHILLSMAAERILGDPQVLDGLLVTLSHPDGMNALLSATEVSAHFTAPPYLMKELNAPQGHLLLSGEEAFGGPFTFIIGVTSAASAKKVEPFLPFLMKKIDEACVFLNENPEEAAKMLAPSYNLPEEELLTLLTAEGTRYGTEVLGLNRFIEFMHAAGYLEQPLSAEDLQYRP
ncbi:MAG: ABC transporter substrate-binding protein [Spirochaetales bacterium]|nr:ABC transporter substrate-binding protein [Spirochaetales bacterium]